MTNVHDQPLTPKGKDDDEAERWLLSKEEFCELMGIQHTRFYEELKSGCLKGVKVGRKTKIAREEAEKWKANLPGYLPLYKRPKA